MKRTIIAATAAALLASATFGVAAPNLSSGAGERPSPEQMADNASAMTDARIAALKAGLRLTADQEKLWPSLETALRGYADERMEQRQKWHERRQAMRDAKGEMKGGAKGEGHDEGRREAARRGPDDHGPRSAERRGPPRDVVAELERRADRMLERGGALKELADAAQPLYATLDPAQKHRFNVLFGEAQGPRMAMGGRWDRQGGPHKGMHGYHHKAGPGFHHEAPPAGPMDEGEENL